MRFKQDNVQKAKAANDLAFKAGKGLSKMSDDQLYTLAAQVMAEFRERGVAFHFGVAKMLQRRFFANRER